MGEIIRNGESYSGFDGEEYLPLSGGAIVGNVVLQPPDLESGTVNTPILQWKDSKRSIWAGIRNDQGGFYLWDGTNNKGIISSTKGRNTFFGNALDSVPMTLVTSDKIDKPVTNVINQRGIGMGIDDHGDGSGLVAFKTPEYTVEFRFGYPNLEARLYHDILGRWTKWTTVCTFSFG